MYRYVWHALASTSLYLHIAVFLIYLQTVYTHKHSTLYTNMTIWAMWLLIKTPTHVIYTTIVTHINVWHVLCEIVQLLYDLSHLPIVYEWSSPTMYKALSFPQSVCPHCVFCSCFMGSQQSGLLRTFILCGAIVSIRLCATVMEKSLFCYWWFLTVIHW